MYNITKFNKKLYKILFFFDLPIFIFYHINNYNFIYLISVLLLLHIYILSNLEELYSRTHP